MGVDGYLIHPPTLHGTTGRLYPTHYGATEALVLEKHTLRESSQFGNSAC